MRYAVTAAMLLAPTLGFAGGVTVDEAWVPLAPPTAQAHAAFMTITNEGDVARSLVGVTAEGYRMVHLHLSEEKDGIATMKPVHQIEIEPGQSVVLEHGGLHVMLMGPEGALSEGGDVTLGLEFADGETVPVSAKVMPIGHGS